MNWIEIVAVAVGLALDASAVSLSAGASGRSSGGRAAFRLSFHFGLFQFLMPVVGWLAGQSLVEAVGAFDHWIAFGLLGLVGGNMVRAGLGGQARERRHDPSRGWSLVALSIATSIDALAVGFSLGMLGVSLWIPCLVIGIVTAGMSLLALRVGHLVGSRFGNRMELVGGLVLIAIGVKVLVEHLGTA